MNNYGFVRNTDTWGVDSIPFQDYISAGLHGLAFSADDKNLGRALSNARKAGMSAGIWLPAGNEGDPRAYAQRVKQLADKYGADALIPNIEFTGKGYKGSAGWNWNEAMMSELQRLGMPRNMAVAMLPNQDDFNYQAYTSRGVGIMPEAFGANTATDQFDPNAIRQTLLRNGVPESMINTILSPGQFRNGAGSVFTVDDISADQWKQMKNRPQTAVASQVTHSMDDRLRSLQEIGAAYAASHPNWAIRGDAHYDPSKRRIVASRVSQQIAKKVGGG